MNKYLVYDIGGTSIKYSIMDEQANVIESSSTPTPEQGKGAIFKLILDIADSHKQKWELDGVAFSVPAAVDVASGYVYYAGQITDFIGKNLKAELVSIGLPIEFENDANCATLAEKWQGHAKECNSFICMTIGTGIGGGIFLDGDLRRGKNSMAGEVGLMILNTTKSLETLLDTDSFSRVGSTWNLLHRVYEKTGIRLTGIELFERYRQNDEYIIKEVDEFFNSIAIGTANLIHTLAPEKVLFGGGISEQPEFTEHIIKRLKRIRPEILTIAEIEACKFGNAAGQIGALYHFQNMQKNDK
ncbi:ROK family protein [Ferdinandcohnia quinoae]|uniref:ROK family protein n=1 Tax=Fredinandcohnia quinoae TaxID=2918902 RepID=A0AAW5DXZ0_9BACI|nr:ROK family protein [Fredinandcohnia sp. SECRCQ15]MCH1625223.1 ROK family protein [Fredinandcohnia sp. SECRCQ15]